MHGDAVRVGTRLELVRQPQPQVPRAPAAGESGGGVVLTGVGQQQLAGVGEQVGGLGAGLLPPAVEVAGRGDTRGHARVEERRAYIVVGHQPAPTRPALDLLGLRDRLAVGRDEGVVGAPLPLHERVPHEELAGHRRVERRQRGPAPGHERHAVEHDALVDHALAALGVPARLGVGALGQVAGQLLGPPRVDDGSDAPPQPGGLDELGHHHPLGTLLRQRRPGPQGEAGVAGTEVVALVALMDPEVGEQAGQQRLVHAVGRCRGGVDGQAEVTAGRAQLAVEVLPLAHAQVVQVLVTAQPAEGTAREGVLLLAQVGPEVEVGQEVRRRVGEAPMRGIGGALVLGGSLARVLHREARDDDEHLGQRALGVGLEQHAPQTRVDRELREPASHRREPPPQVGARAAGRRRRTQCAELLEQLDPRRDLAPVGRVEEGERRDVAETERGHAQDHRGQRGAADLGVGELRPRVVVGLAVEPDGDAVGHPPAAPGALAGRGLRHRLDRQPLHLEPVAVPGDASGAGVDDVADAGHGQRGLRDVRGQHDATAGVRGEDPVLLGGRQARVERHHLGQRQVEALEHLGGVADLPLPGEEHEDVAVALARELLDRVDDALRLVARGVGLVGVVLVGARRLLERAVADLHGVGATADLDDRGAAEVVGEPLRVDGGAGDDQPQVGAPRQQLVEVAEQEVDGEAAFVRLVDDEGVVAQQVAVAGDLGEQDAVGHELDQGRVGRVVGEAHLVAHRAAELDTELLGDALGHRAGGDPPRLGVADGAAHPAAELEADLGQLRGLARAGLARDDDDLVVTDGRGDALALLAHREVGGVADLGHRRCARAQPRLGHDQVVHPAGEGVLPPGRVGLARERLQPTPEPGLVAQPHLAQQRLDGLEVVRGAGHEDAA